MMIIKKSMMTKTTAACVTVGVYPGDQVGRQPGVQRRSERQREELGVHRRPAICIALASAW
jgi:hypothetical protein